MSPPRPKTPDPDSDPARSEAEKIERWKRIDELLEAALERPDSERAGFLEAACAGDQSLRIEVESLLSADARSSSIVESPAAEMAKRVLDERHGLTTGQRIGHYQVISLLGKGGMGAVYLSEDLRLGRKVALKLLPDYFTRDEQRVRRFEQEARAASNLNHPNLLVIYDIGVERDIHFIATEYIEGSTVRERMASTAMSPHEALEVATQVASALAVAHKAGIVHRDIKPEDIMLRPDGVVKVLDFGLAKLAESQTLSTSTEAATVARVDTEPGTIMGTVNYMSPEQARGQQVDARTDLFSLGVVLYEMLTGRCPFIGETKTDVLASILNAEPHPIARYQPDAPAELQRIVGKALRKEREERCQTARELLLDLKSLTEELEFESRLERSTSTDSKANVAASGGRGVETSHGALGEMVPVTELAITRIKRHWTATALVLLALVVAGAAIIYYLPKGGSQKPIESLVILPFDNANNDPDTEYLSDGITETLINSFSQLPRLKVMARTTAFRYKGKASDPQQAGRELSVEAVLTGRITQQRENLVIQVDLISVADGSQIWGGRYTRKVSEVLMVEDEIANAIKENLRLKLTGEEQRKLSKQYTDNTEAYEAYLQGRYWLNKRSEEGFKKAQDYFNQAIAKDVDYALAYSGLADCYGMLGTYLLLDSNEAYPKAKEAAMKALAIDDQLAEAHASMGYLMLFFDWNWSGSEREFHRAIELNPNYSLAHVWYSQFLSAMARHQEAIAEANRAVEVDPFSAAGRRGLGGALCLAGEYDQAIAQLKLAMEMEQNLVASLSLHAAYEAKGMYEEANRVTQEWLRSHPDHYPAIALLARDYALLGKKVEAKKTLRLLDAPQNQRFTSAFFKAAAYESLGDYDKVFELLHQACERREAFMIHINVVIPTVMNRLRPDPRFRDILLCVGLPE